MSRKSNHKIYNKSDIIGDFNDDLFLNKNLKNIHTIIHAAALTRSSNIKSLYEANEKITKKLIVFAEKNSVRRFIFLSTDLANNANGNYGKSKLACERIIRGSKITDWVILRLSPFIFSYRGDTSTTFGKMFKNLEIGKTIILPNAGNFYVAPLLASDFTSLIKKIINVDTKIKNLYNVAGQSYLLKELLHLLAQNNKKKVKLFSIPLNLIIFFTQIGITIKLPLSILESLIALRDNKIINNKQLITEFNFKPKKFEQT